MERDVRVVPHEELAASTLELRTADSSESLREGSIGGGRISVSRGAGVVQGCEDARRSLLLDQVADDLVVKVVDRSPLQLHMSKQSRERGGGRTLICSRTYSSCSVLSVSWMKICCSFSLT